MNKISRLLCALLVISLSALLIAGCAKELTLTLWGPEDGVTVTKPSIDVRGKVSDPKAAVMINDTKASLGKKGTFSTKIALTEGENTIKVVATRGEKVATKTVTITYSLSG